MNDDSNLLLLPGGDVVGDAAAFLLHEVGDAHC